MSGPAGPGIAEVAQMLRDDADAIAREVFPAGRLSADRREWCIGDISGEPGQSLRVCIAGPRRGLWIEHADGTGGDILDLVASAHFAGSRTAALDWARRRYGLEGASTGVEPAGKRMRPAPPVTPAGVERSEEERRAKAIARAQALWLGAEVHLRDTPVDQYLQGRGLSLAKLGRQPRALRYHPEAWCAPGGHRPAMVACIVGTRSDGRGQTIGCHRTYLARDPGSGKWIKAPISEAKKVLGRARGGVIPIWRGASGKALRLAPADDTVVLTEGIEDALTVAMAWPEARVLACVSVGNIGAIDLPSQLRDVIVARDADPPGSAADEALRRACQTLIGQGRRVRVAVPPGGRKDFNAALRAQGSPGPALEGVA